MAGVVANSQTSYLGNGAVILRDALELQKVWGDVAHYGKNRRTTLGITAARLEDDIWDAIDRRNPIANPFSQTVTGGVASVLVGSLFAIPVLTVGGALVAGAVTAISGLTWLAARVENRRNKTKPLPLEVVAPVDRMAASASPVARKVARDAALHLWQDLGGRMASPSDPYVQRRMGEIAQSKESLSADERRCAEAIHSIVNWIYGSRSSLTELPADSVLATCSNKVLSDLPPQFAAEMRAQVLSDAYRLRVRDRRVFDLLAGLAE